MKYFNRAPRWVVFDCVSGSITDVEKFPFEIGSAEGVDLKLNGNGVAEKDCSIVQVKGGALWLMKKDPNSCAIFDGTPLESTELLPDDDHALKVGSHFLVLRGGKNLKEWRAAMKHDEWVLFEAGTETMEGPFPLLDLCRYARDRQRNPKSIACPQGLTIGFHLDQILEVFGPILSMSPGSGGYAGPDPEGLQPSDSVFNSSGDEGALTCLVCWLKFDVGDIMHVAVHDSLRGDPILGEDKPQRFKATRFNHNNQVLDAFGLPCPDMACPHCRHILPPGFLDSPHHIFSIVGDQSAGKSYYLSVLVKMLPACLYQNFSVVFQDADPASNALLNDMKKSLFSALSPEHARLVKTQLEGAMYERVPRYGRDAVAMPRPFVFSLVSKLDSSRRCSAVFYDNAGEHFQPGRDSADSPGAQHVASSSGIFFLFDPFNSPEFRRRIVQTSGHQQDPQFDKPILDQQDVILSEMKVRMKKLLRLNSGRKVTQPLAMMIGKCDAWMHVVGGRGAFRNPVESGRLNLEAVRANSQLVRDLMIDISPAIVANAEEVSESVMYFPVSSFGHPPVKIAPGEYAPDPGQLAPILIEIPTLWVLSQIMPELVPESSSITPPQ